MQISANAESFCESPCCACYDCSACIQDEICIHVEQSSSKNVSKIFGYQNKRFWRPRNSVKTYSLFTWKICFEVDVAPTLPFKVFDRIIISWTWIKIRVLTWLLFVSCSSPQRVLRTFVTVLSSFWHCRYIFLSKTLERRSARWREYKDDGNKTLLIKMES